MESSNDGTGDEGDPRKDFSGHSPSKASTSNDASLFATPNMNDISSVNFNHSKSFPCIRFGSNSGEDDENEEPDEFTDDLVLQQRRNAASEMKRSSSMTKTLQQRTLYIQMEVSVLLLI